MYFAWSKDEQMAWRNSINANAEIFPSLSFFYHHFRFFFLTTFYRNYFIFNLHAKKNKNKKNSSQNTINSILESFLSCVSYHYRFFFSLHLDITIFTSLHLTHSCKQQSIIFFLLNYKLVNQMQIHKIDKNQLENTFLALF